MTFKKLLMLSIGVIICNLVILSSSGNNYTPPFDNYQENELFLYCNSVGASFSNARSKSVNVDDIFESCVCITDFIVDNKVYHQGLQLDIIASIVIDTDSFPLRSNMNTIYQFDMITEAKTECN